MDHEPMEHEPMEREPKEQLDEKLEQEEEDRGNVSYILTSNGSE